MKTLILAIALTGSLGGCVVEPPRVAPVVVRPAVVVPVTPAYYYGPHYGWR